MSALDIERQLMALVQSTASEVSAAGAEVSRLMREPERAERAWVTAEQIGADPAEAESHYEVAVRELKRAQVRADARQRNHAAAEAELRQHRIDQVDELMAPREELTEKAAATLARAEAARAEAEAAWDAAAASWAQLQEGMRRRAMAGGTDPSDQNLRVAKFPMRLDAARAFEEAPSRVPRPPLLTEAAEIEVIDMSLDFASAEAGVAAAEAAEQAAN